MAMKCHTPTMTSGTEFMVPRTNEWVRAQTKVNDAVATAKSTKWRWAGHLGGYLMEDPKMDSIDN